MGSNVGKTHINNFRRLNRQIEPILNSRATVPSENLKLIRRRKKTQRRRFWYAQCTWQNNKSASGRNPDYGEPINVTVSNSGACLRKTSDLHWKDQIRSTVLQQLRDKHNKIFKHLIVILAAVAAKTKLRIAIVDRTIQQIKRIVGYS